MVAKDCFVVNNNNKESMNMEVTFDLLEESKHEEYNFENLIRKE